MGAGCGIETFSLPSPGSGDRELFRSSLPAMDTTPFAVPPRDAAIAALGRISPRIRPPRLAIAIGDRIPGIRRRTIYFAG